MEISHRRHATRQFIECGIAVIHSSECVDAFGKRFGLGREKHLDGMGCHVERKTVDGRRFVFEQHAELRHAPFGPQGYRRNACRMEIAAFGHREIGHGKDLSSYIQTSKSSFGRGGMLTKTNIARKVADEGITVIIANGKRDNILVDILQKPEETLCTRFTPSQEPVSSIKKWIAHSEGFAKGEIHMNELSLIHI